MKMSVKLMMVALASMVCFLSNAQDLSAESVGELLRISGAVRSVPELKHTYLVSDAYYDANVNLNYIYLQQTYLGVKVYNAIEVIAIQNNKLVYHTGRFVNNIENIVSNATASIPASKAVSMAANFVSLSAPTNLSLVQQTSDTKLTFTDGGIARENIEVELCWVSTDDYNTVSLGWNVSIDDRNSVNWWNVRLDANNGNYIEKNNYTVTCNFSNKNKPSTSSVKDNFKFLNEDNNAKKFEIASNKMFAPPPATVTSASYNVIPYPKENINVAPTGFATETDPWTKAGVGNKATTEGWHYDGTTNYKITKGNNTATYDDSLNINNPGRYDTSSTPIPTLTFNHNFNANAQPTTMENRKKATDNLFYWNNIMHDISYQYGFDEAAGNFQNDNMLRGGKQRDFVHAEAQDGSGTDNSNFQTPPDGSVGRMQMYLFTVTNPKRDGDFDNGIISHEFTHGISTRLTGGPNQSGCLSNAEQGGEGWSDYMALMVTTNWSTAKLTDGTLSRTIGNYVQGTPNTAAGIRTYPYSTNTAIGRQYYSNMSKNISGIGIGEVHYIGEIWCQVLWDMTWNIIQQEGSINPNLYDANGGGGNTIALKLVIQGLKLQPCTPGYIDARNAILAADSILYNGKHKCAIWNAFARRGMGLSASQGSSNSVTDQTVAYDVPTGVKFTNMGAPIIVAESQNAVINVTTTCSCKAPTKNYTIKATLPNGTTYVSSNNTGTSGSINGNMVTYSGGIYQKYNQTDTASLTLTGTAGAGCNVDTLINDNRDNAFVGGLTSSSISGSLNWASSNTMSFSAPNSWHVVDDISASNTALTSNAFNLANDISILSFQHYYNMEDMFDAGLVEYSTDNGNTWLGADSMFLKNPYNKATDLSSLLAGAMAFTGSDSVFSNTVVNLSTLKGTNTKIRFRQLTDVGNGTTGNTPLPGWYIDDIKLLNGCGGLMKFMVYDSSNKLNDSVIVPVFVTPKPLPVKYASFSLEQLGNEALLTWVAAEEINTKLYIIERSINGLDWNSLGSNTASGNNKEYLFYDKHPIAGLNYYRIKAVDKDGQISYSIVKRLSFAKDAGKVLIIPNPSRSQSKVYVTSSANSIKVSVFDTQSRLVSSNRITLNNGSFDLNTTNYSNGIYILNMVTEEGNTYTEKLIIQK